MTRSAARRAAILAACAVAYGSLARAESSAATAGMSASARIDMRVVVASIVRASAIRQASRLSIRREDLSRGYVDLDSGTRVALTTNDPHGYAIAVMFDPRIVQRIQVRVQGQTLEADSPAVLFPVLAPALHAAPLTIGYRLFLSRRAAEGMYPWPVRIDFRPLASAN